MTTQEMLDHVNAAIDAIVVGGAVQRYVIRGKDITLASLTELRILRRDLMTEIAMAPTEDCSVILGRLREP